MRRIVTAISAFAMAFSLVAQATPAAAHLPGYESEWRLQTQYETARPGDTQTTLVQFINTGTTTWVKGTATQVDLAVCLPKPNDETCDVASPLASWAVNWLSATRYATHTEASVAPGGIANFTYTYKVPAGTAPGFYTFNGDLVVSSIGGAAGRLHPRGYFHQVQVLGDVAASCTPTAITTTPAFAQNQVGASHTQTATVTCATPTGATTAPPSVGAQVTFIIDAATADTGNADLTLTATTDANGVATVTFTRANPGTDSISVYPTSTPAVRATAVKRWTTAAVTLACTPDTAQTNQNGVARVYTIKTAAASQVVDVTFVDRQNSSTTDNSTATINGVSPAATPGAGSTIEITTDTTGTATFTVTGTGTAATPIVFLDEPQTGTDDDVMGSAEFRDLCGTVTFAGPQGVITVTPDTTATNALGGERVYTISAVDQFGQPFTGTVDVSFVELTDDSTVTTTTAFIPWYDNDATLSTTATASCGQSSGTTTNGTAQRAEFVLNSAGSATFAICSTTATTATPVVWQELGTADNVRQSNEPQDTGGAKTWVAAALNAATISPTAATNPVSSDNPSTNDNSFGEETYTFTLRDQSGNAISPTSSQVVVFSVRNTGSTTIYIVNCDGSNVSTAVPQGTTNTSCQPTITTGGDTAATIEVDSPNAGSAEIKGELATNAAVTATGTKTWVTTAAEPGTGQAEGTVVAFSTAQNWYVISTGTGNVFVDYLGDECFAVVNTTTSEAGFEGAISVGDTVRFRNIASGVNLCGTTTDEHNIVTNQ